MCMSSRVMQRQIDHWNRPRPMPRPPFGPATDQVTRAEVAEFRRLLERAREYDKRTHQPECEMEDKRAKLLELAKELGADVSFV